jgi:hypothetical protein
MSTALVGSMVVPKPLVVASISISSCIHASMPQPLHAHLQVHLQVIPRLDSACLLMMDISVCCLLTLSMLILNHCSSNPSNLRSHPLGCTQSGIARKRICGKSERTARPLLGMVMQVSMETMRTHATNSLPVSHSCPTCPGPSKSPTASAWADGRTERDAMKWAAGSLFYCTPATLLTPHRRRERGPPDQEVQGADCRDCGQCGQGADSAQAQ